eukprot:4309568-Pyramimonas_sp.AAC.1
MYRNALAFSRIRDELVSLLLINSGVMQGCPLSGSLWAFGMDPIIRSLELALPPDPCDGSLGGCADDLGAVLSKFVYLTRLFPSFASASRLASLHLNPLKCVIVPLWAECTPAVTADLRACLRYVLPQWQSFTIAGSAKYLGIYIGPECTNAQQWAACSQK